MQPVKPLNEYHQLPLDSETAQLLLQLLMMEHNLSPEDMVQLNDDMTQSPMYCLIQKRAEFHGAKLSPTCGAVLTELSQGIPGRAVQLLHALVVNTPVDHQISLRDFCQLFHTGIPSDEGFIQAWDAQKDQGVNRLDREVWERRQ